MFWVLDVDFLRAGVEVVGVEAEAEGVTFAILTQDPSTRVRQVTVSRTTLMNCLNKRWGQLEAYHATSTSAFIQHA
jgi:hypothetical protein